MLATSADLVESLTQIAELCVENIAEHCAIHIVLAAIDLNDYAVEAGRPPEGTLGEAGTIVEPLVAGRRRFGKLICRTGAPEGFDAEGRAIVHLVALELSIAIAGQAAVLREHRVADRLARALLPEQLPAMSGAKFHASYRPANDETAVGGDWYDAVTLPDGRIALSVGDVAGHGLDAAVVMGEVRQTMRTAAMGATSPTEVLEHVNTVIRLRESIGMVTAIFGIYDPARSMLIYAVAGHPPPILSLPGGFARHLPMGGLPLGCASAVECNDWTFTIPQGGQVVFYTDGLLENDRDLILGEAQLLAAVRAQQDAPVADPAGDLQERTFRGNANRDDAAVLVLSRVDPVASFVFAAVPFASPLARAAIEQILLRLPIDEDRRFGVLVALGEAIANAVEHGYRGTNPGLLRVEIALSPDALTLTVEDFGRWRPFVPRDERGRGIGLMHAFMDGVQICSSNQSTAIVLKTHLDLVI